MNIVLKYMCIYSIYYLLLYLVENENKTIYLQASTVLIEVFTWSDKFPFGAFFA